MIVTAVFSFLICTLVIISGKESAAYKEAGKKNKMWFFKSAHYLYGRLSNLMPMKAVKKEIKILKPLNWKEELQEFYIEKLRVLLITFFLGTCIMWCVIINKSLSPVIIDGLFINRNTYGKGEINTDITAYSEGWDGGRQFSLSVGEQQYSEEEIQNIFQDIADELDETILGENESADYISHNLNLVNQIYNYPVTILWSSSDPAVIKANGEINDDGLDKQGTYVTLSADLKYYDYQAEYSFRIKVYPRSRTEEQQLLYDIEQQFITNEKDSRENDQVSLPISVNGTSITWKENNNKNLLYVIIITIICCFIIFIGRDKEIENKIKKREKEMMIDYPEIVSKLTILLESGMTLSRAWNKIVDDYHDKVRDRSMKPRFAFEEMSITRNEMNGGIAEAAAYDHFGKRSGIKRYRKLSSLLIRNLKKGSGGLSKLLKEEALEAFEERKRTAKKAGEEAGTKLLYPMMLMFLIVIIIMIVPAFMTFQI